MQHGEAEALFLETLLEEKNADIMLTAIAEESVNAEALQE